MDALVGVLSFGFAALMTFRLWEVLKTGEVSYARWQPGRIAKRERNPSCYWIGVVIHLLSAALVILFCWAFVFRPHA
jgi:hypothetical protein